uniref:Uncharacterized protein n=1 Tax=Vespula pensylvanica TaxID=30213 RepID=A0A834JRU4_VESPE|nr:hypothetical protein H0235_017246 [Vespula pensylvanica]
MKAFFNNRENDQLNPLAHLSDYHIYRIPNARRCFNAPFEWGACLRPRSNAEAEDTEGGEHGLKVIAFHSEKARACWLTAMRLAKVGPHYGTLQRSILLLQSGDSDRALEADESLVGSVSGDIRMAAAPTITTTSIDIRISTNTSTSSNTNTTQKALDQPSTPSCVFS